MTVVRMRVGRTKERRTDEENQRIENEPETGLKVHSAQKSCKRTKGERGKERQHWYRVKKGSIHILHNSKSKLTKGKKARDGGFGEMDDKKYRI